MQSERLGKSIGALRRGPADTGKHLGETQKTQANQVYFSNNPMFDKYGFGKPKLAETRPVKERQTALAEFKLSPIAAEKTAHYGNVEYGSLAKNFFETPLMATQGLQSPMKAQTSGLDGSRSFKLLNQFLHCQDPSQDANCGKKFQPPFVQERIVKPQFSPFVGKVLHQYETEKAARDSSMMSAKSHERMEHIQKSATNTKTLKNDHYEPLARNKTMAAFTNLFEQSKTCREISSPFFMIENKVDPRANYANPSTPLRSPNDSHILAHNGDRPYVPHAVNASPSHSALRFRQTDKSRISALNRSDMSKTSNNNSFLTRRGEDNDLSRVCGQQGESHHRGGMSKTWVKSGLMDSRDENMSTVSSRRRLYLETVRNKTVDRSALDASDEKSTKKKNLYLEIENMFTKELHQSSKDSVSANSRAKEYELHKCIGQGAYAKVYKAVHLPTQTKVAIKLYEKAKLTEKLRQKSIKREIKILSRLNNPNIVNFIDCFSTKNHIYLVMELVRGLSLYELLKKQPDRKIKENNAKTIIKQILKAMVYCHSKCVTHRDIKLENVIISSNGEVKVIDFGFSTCIPNDKKVKMFCGTPSYMAPEITQKIEYCGPPVDIWATGVLFYVLISGRFPFKGSTDKKLYHRICTNEPVFDKDVSEEVQSVILSMMKKNPDERPTAIELLNFPLFRRKKDASPIKQVPEPTPNLTPVYTPRQSYIQASMIKPRDLSPLLLKDDKYQGSASQLALGKTSRVFQEMLANLGRDKQMRTQTEHSPLRDETKRVLNNYYPNGETVAQALTERTIANPQKDIWSARLKKATDENRVKIDIRKIEPKEKSQRKTANATPATYSYRETVKTPTKPQEKPKPGYPSKKAAADEKTRYDKGEFARYLERK